MENLGSQLISTLLALAFVSALAWVSLSLLKRFQQGRLGGKTSRQRDAPMRFVRTLPLGAKERVVVIHYRDEEWLLGVTGGGISLLARNPLDQPAPRPAGREP